MKLLTKYIPTSLCRAYRNSSADTLCVPSVHLSKPFGESDHLRVSTAFTLLEDFAYLIEHIPRRLRLYLYYKEMLVGGAALSALLILRTGTPDEMIPLIIKH